MKTEKTAFQKLATVWQAFWLGSSTGVAALAWYCTRSGLISDGRFTLAMMFILPFLFLFAALPVLCAQAHAGIKRLNNRKMQNNHLDTYPQ